MIRKYSTQPGGAAQGETVRSRQGGEVPGGCGPGGAAQGGAAPPPAYSADLSAPTISMRSRLRLVMTLTMSVKANASAAEIA